ncbi:MAG: hypothetical protein QW560_00630 [Candidatus Nitrosocaldus sp.]
MVEVLWFEDIEPLKQSVFDFPLLGRINMKQMGIVGSASIIALASKDILTAMVSLTVALFIAMIRYRAVSMDELIYSLILYAIRHKVKPLIGMFIEHLKELFNNDSKRMLATVIDKIGIDIGRCGWRRHGSISARDYDDNMIILNSNPVRLRLRLLTKDGRAVANRLARIYVDDVLFASITSDHNGELDVMLTLASTKNSNLSVYVDDYSKPLLEKIIAVRSA